MTLFHKYLKAPRSHLNYEQDQRLYFLLMCWYMRFLDDEERHSNKSRIGKNVRLWSADTVTVIKFCVVWSENKDRITLFKSLYWSAKDNSTLKILKQVRHQSHHSSLVP